MMNNRGVLFIRSVNIFFWIAVGLILLLFLGLSYYTYPSGDDYTFANHVVQKGFWGSQKVWYNGLTGRYTYVFAMSVIMRSSVFENGIYFLIPLLAFLGIGGALYFFSGRIIPQSQGRFSRASWVAAFMALYLTHLPYPGSLYWAASIIKYQLVSILSLLFAAVMIGKPGQLSGARNKLSTLGAGIMAVLAIGASETMMFMIIYTLVVGTAFAFILRGTTRRRWLIILGIAALSSGAVYFAPGNSIRFAHAVHSRDPGMLLPALRLAVVTILRWIISPGLILLSILFVMRIREEGSFPRRWRPESGMILIPPVWIVGIVLSFLPSAWGGAIPPFPRTANLIYFIFLVGWFWSLVIITPLLFRSRPAGGITREVIKIMALLLLAVSFVLQSNAINAAADFISLGPRFKASLREREELISASIAGQEMETRLPVLSVQPRSIVFHDIAPDPGNWKNQAFAYYHHLTRVLIFDPEISHPKDRERFARLLSAGKIDNILSDPGFESGGGDWGAAEEWIDQKIVHSGRTAIHLTAEMVPGGNFWMLKQGPITLDAGRDYVFGAFIKTRGLNRKVYTAINKLNSQERWPYYSTPGVSKDSDWTLLIGVFRPRPGVGEKVIEIEFRAGRITDFQEGEFWVDDVFLLPVDRFPGN